MASPFRQCHLTILRSLYEGKPNASGELAAADDASLDEGNSVGKGASNSSNKSDDVGDTTPADLMGGEQTGSDNLAAEAPCSDETWELIETFLDQRSEYLPRKQRQQHWVQLNAESQSRLDNLLSIAAEAQEKTALSSHKKKATPSLTPLLNMMKKRPTTPTLSLTPLSSNRKDAQHPGKHEHEISSWTFINRMVQKRANLCTSSCESFRSQPFLEKLYAECNSRCNVLAAILQRLRRSVEIPGDKSSGSGEKRAAAAKSESQAKRQKIDDDVDADQIANSQSSYLGPTKTPPKDFYFFRDYQSIDAHSHNPQANQNTTNMSNTVELINETQIKLCLWSNLLSSVREIVDEK